MFNDIYKGKRIFITGHSGFKGSWLTQWLIKLGAIVKGYSLQPEKNSHFNLLGLEEVDLVGNQYGDIRNFIRLEQSIKVFQPDLVFHLAAQPLVLESYKYPIETFDINIMGTVNLLEACKNVESILGIIVITTDKIYKNNENNYYAYRETDELGAHDPYSTSKACCELIVDNYQSIIQNKFLTTVRAGNVLGGGDFAENRLIPDYVKAVMNKEKFVLRNPFSTRPYQYILDVLTGYLYVGEEFLNNHNLPSLNFGPNHYNDIKNIRLIEMVKENLPHDVEVLRENINLESNYLSLDSTKARKILGWQPKYNIDNTIQKTMQWYKRWIENNEVITNKQIDEYMEGV
jgi:CDP-glucose 4,6-dehydratase